MGFLCWGSVSSQGHVSRERGVRGQAVAVQDVNGSKRQGKRLVMGVGLAMTLKTGKVRCSWLDHSRMKWRYLSEEPGVKIMVWE